jgi:hypothetical protein
VVGEAKMIASDPADQQSSNWQAGLLRLTAFYPEPLDIGSVSWWEKLTGASPDIKNIRMGLGQLIEQGVVNDQVLLLQIQPARIDWFLSPKDDPQSGEFPSLGSFEESLGNFQTLISKWWPSAPPLNRLAFGAQLVFPAADQKAAMKIIAHRLSYVKINWEGIQDFVFQANRPEPSLTVPEFGPINRLAKLQAIVRKKVIAMLAPEPQSPVTTAEEFGVYSEFDISTTPQADTKMTLPPGRLVELLAELTDHAVNILSKGFLP